MHVQVSLTILARFVFAHSAEGTIERCTADRHALLETIDKDSSVLLFKEEQRLEAERAHRLEAEQRKLAEEAAAGALREAMELDEVRVVIVAHLHCISLVTK
jgi:hypothetical protein